MPVVRTVVTGDGTVTLQVPELNEHYHSVHGAMQESMHVFIQNGLHAIDKNSLKIFEVGFGTGLNVLLTKVLSNVPVQYHAIEFYPLPENIVSELNYAQNDSEKNYFELIHAVAWDQETDIGKNFFLKKIKGDILIYQPETTYDIIYFDAFGPNTQPEMWTKEILSKMYSMLNPGGILVTYCAKGDVKRTLKEIGFEVESLPGPPGKREMTRGKKPIN